MSTEQRLQQITNEMRGLCAELENADGMSDGEREHLSEEAARLCSELDTEFGVPAFRPEVPEATQEMFFRLVEAL